MPKEEAEFEELLALYCAPVLKKVKIGNIFHISCKQFDNLKELIQRYEKRLSHHGLQFYLFQEGLQRLTIYVYHKEALKLRLSRSDVKVFLSEFGYPIHDLSSTFKHLNERLCEGCSYPHEIGIFLGYPLEDVKGFISNKTCQLCGYWKVYANPMRAQAWFKLFDRSRDELLDGVLEGKRIECLI